MPRQSVPSYSSQRLLQTTRSLVLCTLLSALAACSSLQTNPSEQWPEAAVTDASACAALPVQLDSGSPASSVKAGTPVLSAVESIGSATPVASAMADPAWAHISFVPFKLESHYTFMACNQSGQLGVAPTSFPMIRVDADASASMFQTPVSVQVTESTRLQWKWFLSGVSGTIDNRRAKTEDSPLRVVLAFDGDRTTLPEDEQSFLNQMDWLTGRKAPYATLMYVLGSGAKNDEVVSSTHTDTIRFKIVQQASDRSLHNHWQTFSRTIYKDYVEAFGRTPGRLIGVGVMGDMDNTKHKSRAYVSHITLDGRVLIQPLAASGKR